MLRRPLYAVDAAMAWIPVRHRRGPSLTARGPAQDVTEVGTEVDLVLSFISVVATEAWTVFF